MIYLKLFLSFLKIGAVSFGGGYGMMSLIRETVLENAWMTEEELLNFFAVAESTPGPIAVNIATFIGSSQGGFLGALLATLGIVLPSFVIILLIATVLTNFLKYKGVEAFLSGMRPCIVGLILMTAVTLGLSLLGSVSVMGDKFMLDVSGVVILAILLVTHGACSVFLKKKPSPIVMILLSAGLGIIFYI